MIATASKPSAGEVYVLKSDCFIRLGEQGDESDFVTPYKIGFSNDPESRLWSMRTAMPCPCEIFCTWKAPQSFETFLHRVLNPWLIVREWFALDEETIWLAGGLPYRVVEECWRRIGGPMNLSQKWHRDKIKLPLLSDFKEQLDDAYYVGEYFRIKNLCQS